jgi:hypothetical protein
VVEDWYKRFVAPDKAERHYVGIGRLATVLLAILAAFVSLSLENAFQVFNLMLQIGAGTGLIYLLRWFWWRISAWTEIAGMVISFAVALWFQFLHTRLGFAPLAPSVQLLVGVGVTTVGWFTVTLLTPPTDRATLQSFYDRIRPMWWGWRGAVATRGPDPEESVTAAFLCWFLGLVTIYTALFGTGYLIYGSPLPGVACLAVGAIAAAGLLRTAPKVGFR